MTLTEDLTGRPLGKYELRERVGRGGMAEVYKAYQPSLDRFVAVKVLHSFLSEDPEFKDRFQREAVNIGKLRHNNIVQVYDYEFEPGPDLYYMVMEFVDGPTLRSELLQKEARGERIPLTEVVRIARHVASALAYARENDMIHRDIKPGNIMLDKKDNRVVLTDFGIAKIISGQHITASGTMIGTPAYMAPEQGLGQPGDHRSDIYSLGVVMFQMAAGTPPYEADTPIALVLKHVNDPLPPLSTFNPDLPEGLENVIYKCLAKNPDERFQKAEELVKFLEDLESAVDIVIPPETPSEITPAVPPPAPSRTIVTEPPFAKTGRERRFLTPVAVGAFSVIAVAAITATALMLRGQSLPDGTQESAEALAPTDTDGPAQEVTETLSVAEVAISEAEEALDLEATALVATLDIVRAQRATQAAVATNPVLGTDLAPLVPPGCDYDYALVTENPQQEAAILEHATITKQITLRNSGECAWEDGVTLAFLDGSQMGAPDQVAHAENVPIGNSVTFEFDLTLPGYSVNDSRVQSTWVLRTHDGKRIGRLVTFYLQIVPPTATPTLTSTPTLTPTASSTPTPIPTVDPTIIAVANATATAAARP